MADDTSDTLVISDKRKIVRKFGRPIFSKDATVLISVSNMKVMTASKVIAAVQGALGEDSILSCVPKNGDVYEVSLIDIESARAIVDKELKIDNQPIFVRHLSSKVKVVSFMHLSGLITDEQIESKLKLWRVELLGPIKRRRYENTDVFDGTRPGCSIVAFAIELIHHSWDTIPLEGFKYSSSSLATDNLVRYGVQPRVLEIFVDFYLVDLEKVWEFTSYITFDLEEINPTFASQLQVVSHNYGIAIQNHLFDNFPMNLVEN
ncbi:hypothetical protein LOTGIDRAFT_175992 [Lottia gigantea]|uniref:Uncharacterized protein n=1 Tax=Lottia gigantea TaxID=225164 RepID=V4BDK0_LOTGI|nr:hypothetical protein LOTGIDRAFT_175992 [Lottia gigantea]ESO86734.1 hypothetical protein LOTGIDRAFT_175992 [Lottia gigantea]